MPRITIRLDKHLLAEAKALAARTNRSLTAWIQDSVREALARSRPQAPHPPVRLTTYGGGGIQPGVPLDSSEIWDYLDEVEGVFDQFRRGK